jgi:thiamine pyrophosphokinase
MASRQAIIFIGGDRPHENSLAFAEPDALVIAADSGWEHALASGRVPQVLIGDMDSISQEHLQDARSRDVDIIEHPADKDHTDTELALQFAESLSCENIHVVTGGGDRFDHVLSMIHSLVSFSENATVTAHIGQSFVRIVTPREKVSLPTHRNDTVSLIPLGGHARGVTTSGLKWNLTRSTLRAFASRGVSNVAQSPNVTISVRTGVIAAIITPNPNTPDIAQSYDPTTQEHQ